MPRPSRPSIGRRPVAKPFVVTVAAVAVASVAASAGCGARIETQNGNSPNCSDPTVSCNPPSPPPMLPVSDSGVTVPITIVKADASPAAIDAQHPTAACPATEGDLVKACATPGLRCNYGDCMGSPTTIATCQSNGQWSVMTSSCNPPPPVCPSEAPPPSNATACAVVGQTCNYGNCRGSPVVFAKCAASLKWEVAIAECDPPPSACPQAEPTLASACAVVGQTCEYPTTADCEGCCGLRYTCGDDAKWSSPVSTCRPSSAVDAGHD